MDQACAFLNYPVSETGGGIFIQLQACDPGNQSSLPGLNGLELEEIKIVD